MVTIRLSRHGSKKRPFYHIVVADSRCKRDGRFIERVGFFNPMAAPHEQTLKVDRERYASWVAKGARASERVLSLVKRESASA
ncbi:MAG: 30S ribosomal protein S16 [Gammaproteobacteria bacterium]